MKAKKSLATIYDSVAYEKVHRLANFGTMETYPQRYEYNYNLFLLSKTIYIGHRFFYFREHE